MTTVETIDFDAVFDEIAGRLQAEKERRLAPPLIRLWDGNWNLRGIVRREISASFQWLNNETGIGRLELPIDYFITEWLVDHDARSTRNVHITVDKDGARWGGRMEECEVKANEDGSTTVVVIFKHDYEELKHILCWSNPFLPAEIQFPRLWMMFSRARHSLATTLLVNIMRLESSMWMLPDDPLDPAQWFNFDQSTWSMVVKPRAIEDDYTLPALVHSRFKYFHDVAKNVLADAQLTVECRRYLEGDPEPWPGANLRHGCLVIDIVDKSGFTSETSFGGDIFGGLVRAFTNIDGDGLTEGIDIIDDPNYPAEYSAPGFKGTLPVAPWVVFRDGEQTGIQTSSFKFKPATDVQIVAGGHSMPFVNELISQAIQMAGDLTAMIPFTPPIGGALDAVLAPLYTDTILAFGAWKNVGRAQKLGWSHYHEKFAEGADRAYTLGWLLAMRTGMWQTKETTSHELVVADGSPFYVGERGFGHFFLGDRIGSTVRGMPKGRVYVDRVHELVLAWSRSQAAAWKITIGQREIKDPVLKAWEALQEILSLLRDLGVL